MSYRFLIILLVCLACPVVASAQPSGLSFMNVDDITVCPANADNLLLPDFTSDFCKPESFENVDPQGRLIWVKTIVPLTETRGPNGEPLSIYISGKMSSEVYLNREFVGRNGMPSFEARNEIAGRMDAELFPPQDLFRTGGNEVVFLASSHQGIMDLRSPLHMVGIAPAGIYANGVLPRFGPTLMTFGLFVLGSIYFGIMAFIGTLRGRFLTLSAICFFAGGQLISESLRGLIPYAYPVHDLRLIAIAGFSSAFGLSVAYHVFRSFMTSRLVQIMAGLLVLSLAAMIIFQGFDYKALAGMSAPLIASLIAAGFWSYQGRSSAFLYFIALLAFVISIMAFRGFFLDTVFFLLVAFFLILLFIEQALKLAEEARERRKEEVRANRLEQALAEAEERTDTHYINVKTAGKMERIATSQILQCQGAGGYSEIVLISGRTVLHAVSLNEMENSLPATFLRVHRSHLINVIFVKSLQRDPAGTGTLKLAENVEVPVSRRIMPKVRQALA